MSPRDLLRPLLGASLLVLLLGASPLAARADDPAPAPPVGRLGVRTAPLLLLTRLDVQAELRLSREQATSAERLMQELHEKAASLRGKNGSEVVSARRAIDEAQERWIESQLTETQRKRLVQIDLQWEGPSALISRSVVSEALSLSADQRSKLTKAVAERNRQRAEGHNQPADERALAEQALAVLTPAQKAQWKEMLGHPFVPHDAQANAKAQPPR